MKSDVKGIAVVLFGFGIAAFLAAPAASQAEGDNPTVERTPGRLWRLYPLDPDEMRAGKLPQAQTDPLAPAPSPAPNDVESDVQRDIAPEDDAAPSRLTILVAFTLACAGALLIILTRRRAPWRVRPTQAAGRGVRTPPQIAAGPSTEIPPEPSFVRVHLRDGRMMEGAVKHVSTRDSPVLLLDVVDMSDAKGQRRDPEPTDAFVPLVEVERIETIDNTDANMRDEQGHPQ